MSPTEPDVPEPETPDQLVDDPGLDALRRQLRALYRVIEAEPIPEDLRHFAERLQREFEALPPADEE